MTAKLAAMCRSRAVVHVATWSDTRDEVVPVCHGRPVKWAARWTGADAREVTVTCNRCRRALDAGRVKWDD